MQENLLSPTNITLFGRVFPLSVDTAALPAALGANHFLRDQLAHGVTDKKPDARFARIYAISYEGQFYNLSRPAIFLVHGNGSDIPGAGLPVRAANSGSSTDQTGLAVTDFDFERSTGAGMGAGHGIKYWEYDKGDFTLRLDAVSGTFEDVLLDAEVDTQLQISGAGRVQTSGAGRVQTSSAGRVQMSHAGRMQMAHRNRE